MWPSTMVRLGSWASEGGIFRDSRDWGGCDVGYMSEFLMKEVSVKRKGSSLKEGQGVEIRVSEEASLIFWRGETEEEEEEE